jgi:NADH-quinone oxidoreductase subunit L
VLTAAASAASVGGVFSLTWVLIALPLLSAAIMLLGGRRTNPFGHVLGVLAPAASFVLAVFIFFALIARTGEARAIDQHLFSWLPVNGFQVDAGLLLDPLSMAFVLLITGVGTLIHVYSVGYMAHDPDRRRFFGYMNLFTAAMLLLVLGNSFLALYVGWEGVGLASYLLIGFWFYKPVAATAAKKAFIVNRVGDVGLSLAIMLMFATVGTTSFTGVFGAAGAISAGTATALALLLLLGACGKSGQFPLQTWLPDAMEGPTPVSALIHAATMVTAGAYLIARSAPIYNQSSAGRTVVAIVGAVTLLIGCIIGCAYDDIKKVLAYSTVSQIGYMFLAVGLGGAGYAVGIFHLLTHGFFKATLFLGAGSIMHAMGDQVNIRRFGGLRTLMPVTFVTFMCGYLAIIGFPFFSGFYSKDAIIETAYDKGGTSGWLLGTIALVGAGLTAYYMTRLVMLTFFGERRWTDDVHPHESPPIMTVPMVVLAAGAVLSGYLLKEVFDLKGFLAPVLGESPELGAHTISPTVLTLLTLLVIAGGVFGAYAQYGRRAVPITQPVAVTPVTTAARRNLYADAFNESVLMRPGQYLTRSLVYADNRGIDGGVNGLAALIGGSSGRLRRLQTGFVRSYALSMFAGTAAVVVALLLVRFA